MNNKIFVQILILSSFLFSGCFVFKGDKLAVQTTITNKKALNATLTSVNVANNQVTITGTGFSNISSVKLQGNGVDATLSVDSKSDTQIIARATSALSLLVNGTFNLIIGTVEAQATYPITFTLQNGAIEAVHLSQMNAAPGQVLKWSGSGWVPGSLANSQVYLGNWNATSGLPGITVTSSFQNGDYLIVTTGGTYSSSALVHDPTTFVVGDWIMFNGAKWDRIDNTSNVVGSFQGRAGVVTLQASDYVSLKDTTSHKLTGSSLNDLADINLSVAPADGQVLKWNASTSKWVASDDTTSGGSGSIVTSELASGAVTYVKMTINDGELPIAKLAGTSDATKYLRGDKSWQALNTDAVTEGSTNLYFLNSRVLGSALTGFSATNSAIVDTDTVLSAFGKTQGQINSLGTLGSGYLVKNSTDSVTGQVTINATTGSLKIPTTPNGTDLTDAANVQYVKTYADLKLPMAGGTLSGDLQANTKIKFQDSASNTAALKAPTTITSSYVLTLPTGLGSANQVLTTDASGVLSWTTPSTTATPSGSAGGDLSGTYPSPTLKTAVITDSHIATTLSESKITNLVNDLAAKVSTTLTSGNLFVGSNLNVATGVALSGDATIANTGALTLNTVGVAKGGTGLTAGTSGGIPYYSSSSTMTSSGVLASNGVMLGGGAGVAPSTTAAGTSNQILSVPAAGGAPSFGSIDLSTTAAVGTSILPIANGGTGAASVTANYVFAGPTSIGGAPTFRALASGDLPSGTVSGSGTTNYVPYYSATTTLANSPIAISGSNVGIGTTSPTSTLTVSGTTSLSGVTTQTGSLLFGGDGTYDIGSASANRPATIYTYGLNIGSLNINNSNIQLPAAGAFYWGGRSILETATDGNLKLSNYARNGFGLLQLGGSTSSFPSIKRNGTGIDFRLADDSGYSTISAQSGIFNGSVGIGTTSPTTGTRLDVTGTGATASSIIIPRDTVANRPTTGVNGMIRYASDTNKFEAYENGAWTNIISTSGTPSGAASGDLSGTYPSPTISGLAATKIGSGTVSNTAFGYLSAVTSDIQAQLNAKTTSTLASTNIFVGNGSNVATAVALSGDATLANTGALTLNTVTVAKGGTGLTAGTSGGIPYFSSTSTMASSGVLAANGVVLGAGAGAAPTSTAAGTADQVLRIPAAGGAPAFGAIDLTKSAAVTGALPVANGGTGATTLASNGILYGNGTSAVGATAAATTPSVLLSTVTTNVPAWTTSTAGNFLQGSVTGAVFAPITNISPGADFTITQNSVVPFTSVNSGAVANTLYLKAGNVGVGTTSPTSLLHTSETAAKTAAYTGVLHNVANTSSTASINKIGMDIESTGTWNGTSAVNTGLVVNATGGTTNYAAIFSGGNVGIGTTSPSSTLDVTGTANISTSMLVNQGNNVTNPTFSVKRLATFDSGTTSNIAVQIYGRSGQTADLLQISETGAGGYLTVKGNGPVGIGTTSPTTGTRLDITGTGATTSSIIIPRDTVANRPTTGVNGMIRYASDTNKFEAYENGAWTNIISTSGTPSGAASGDLSGTYPSPTITGLAATKIGSGTVSNTAFGYLSAVTSDIQAQLNAKTTSTLASTNIFVGNGSNVATAVALSGDATLANTGSLTLNGKYY